MKNKLSGLMVPTFSPLGFLVWAALIGVLFATVHLLGWRDATTILTGTVQTGLTAETAAAKAMVYLIAYFGAVLAVPILVLAAALSGGWLRVLSKRKGSR